MYQLVLLVQCICILAMLAECFIVFINWKGVLHSYLFLGCVSTLVNNAGYYFQLRADSEEVYFTALKFSYFGRVWIAYALFLFIAELVGFRLSRPLKSGLALLNLIVYGIVCTTDKTSLYYKEIGFEKSGLFPVFLHENGILHNLWNIVLMLYILYGLTLLVMKYRKEENPAAKARLSMVLLAILTQSVFLVLQIINPSVIRLPYDFTMPGFTLGAIFMFIAIFKYDLLDTGAIAREYVIDELSEAIIAVDADGSISYYNKPALKLFPGLVWEATKIVDMINDTIKTGEPIRLKDRYYSPEANALSKGGANAGTVYSLTDDTEHYNYMAGLEEQKLIADNANKAKSDFLANMSHEIRTPINAILGMDEMILRESSEKEIVSYAGDIRTAGRTLLSLINDILDFSKIEEGRMEIIPTQYKLSDVVGDVVNMVRDRAQKKGLKLNVSVDAGIPNLLYGDEIRIKQIALNLLTNAVKYTEAGEVSLGVSCSMLTDEETELSFAVSDTGIGIKEEDIDRLFSPFTRIEEKRNRSIEGTGLGMSIVNRLLSLMDSELKVKSVYGKGSEFSFKIKQRVVNREPIGDMTERLSSSGGTADSYHELFHAPLASMLVVDDTELNLTVVKSLLKQTKIKIDTAASGAQALEAAAVKHYDVIFIDDMMPDMDGVETLHRMKDEALNSDASNKTAYIAFTANAVSGSMEKYLSEGFDDYVSKPVNGTELEKMLRKHLPDDKVTMTAVTKSDRGETDTAGRAYDGRRKILTVDDDEMTCKAAEEILGRDYSVLSCIDGKAAAELAAKERPDLILLDINLVDITGFEVMEQLKEDARTRDIPIMFITADEDRKTEVMGLKNGADDYIIKPFVPEVLLQRSRHIITLDIYRKELKGEVHRQTIRAERITKEMMVALSHTVDAKDHYTNGHSERVAAYAAEIGRRMGKSTQEQRKLYEIGLLHDIGKIGVPEEIINKTARLTDEEFALIKEHTRTGFGILKGIKDMPELAQGARHHHERYDGKGYPDGLEGKDIPEVARIICVADCYDAMTSTRAYSEPKPQEKVRDEIVRCSGSQFDPRAAEIMLSMIDADKEYQMHEKGSTSVWKNKEWLWDADVTEEEVLKGSGNESVDRPGNPMGRQAFPEWLEGIPDIDVAKGISGMGDAESYLTVLDIFRKTAGYKADEIEKLYADGDMENYTIKVHALKSSARIIGADELSEMARRLELAGREGDTDTIKSDTDELIRKYRELGDSLSPLGEDEYRKSII